MKTKSFDDYLKNRLDKEEIKKIEQQAKMEFKALKLLQNDIASAFSKYMDDKNIGFNEMARRLQISPGQIDKIQKGEANLTLASIAHIAALLQKQAHIIFKKTE